MRNILSNLLVTPVLVLLLGAMVSGCNRKPGKDQEEKKGKGPAAVLVEVATITRGPIEAIWKSSTSLEAEEQVKVYSRAANRVTELLVEEGSEVKQGDVLLRLESEAQRIARDKAQSSYEKSKGEFQRQETLFGQQLISREIFDEAKYNLRQLELSLADATREFNYTEVRAPIDGTITVRLVRLGDLVSPNQHLFDMVDFKSIVARVFPPEKLLNHLEIRQAARVRTLVNTNKVFPAFVKRISPIVEGRTSTVKVTLGFDDVATLRPGMYVYTEIVLATHDQALLIPKRALVYDGDQTYVYRMGPGRKAERLLLEAELTDNFNVTPVAGFSEGEQIIVAGQTGLKDGATVRLSSDPEPEPEEKKKK